MSSEPIMQADEGHAFSGGALSERGRMSARHSAASTRSESVTHHEAAPALGGTGEYRVLELPRTVEIARFPTLEAAQAYALALNLWVDQRPDPADVQPFFRAPDLRAEPDFAQLEAIFQRGERPERMGL